MRPENVKDFLVPKRARLADDFRSTDTDYILGMRIDGGNDSVVIHGHYRGRYYAEEHL